MKDTTICFPIRNTPERQILLGMKKRGHGMGKYNGFGGKIETGESRGHAAVRELYEESKLITKEENLIKLAEITFLFPYKKEWNETTHVYLIDKYIGIPRNTSEMTVHWFDVDKIPYHKMWSTDKEWLPYVLDGKRIVGTFNFNKDNESFNYSSITRI